MFRRVLAVGRHFVFQEGRKDLLLGAVVRVVAMPVPLLGKSIMWVWRPTRVIVFVGLERASPAPDVGDGLCCVGPAFGFALVAQLMAYAGL